MSEVHVLYRFFAADDRLLYVGITKNPSRRFEKHGYEKPWWSQVARIEMQHCASREELREAERLAIQGEHPAHNIRMNGGGRDWPQEVCSTSHCGLKAGDVYALGLDDGECPTGIVTALDDEGVTLTPYNWGIGVFNLSDTWVHYDTIVRWKKAEREKITPGQPDSNGWYHPGGTGFVFLMDPLADFQSRWHEEHRVVL